MWVMWSDVFGWKLIHDTGFRGFYHNHPAGLVNDFVKIYRTLNTSLDTIAWGFLAYCLLLPAMAFIMHRYRKYIWQPTVYILVTQPYSSTISPI